MLQIPSDSLMEVRSNGVTDNVDCSIRVIITTTTVFVRYFIELILFISDELRDKRVRLGKLPWSKVIWKEHGRTRQKANVEICRSDDEVESPLVLHRERPKERATVARILDAYFKV